MIIVKLSGGLGNQMFQYAAGKRLALHLDTDLQIDASWFDNVGKTNNTPRSYELGCFAISANIRSRSVVGFSLRKPKLYQESSFEFDPALINASDNTVINGYWQSERYFVDVRDVIRREYTFIEPAVGANKTSADKINNTNAVSIHIRRGDYVTDKTTSDFHGLAELEYYYKSSRYIADRLKGPHFFVFSDDPEWCRDNLKLGHPTTYIDHNPPSKGFEDLRLMSICKHHIIANSSFSWWGAWLNPSPDKIVIAPSKWFNNTDLNTKDIYPKEWLKF